MAKTYRLSEKELLDLGFSKVSARALRYVFESIGDGATPDLTLVELNEVIKDLAYTPSATTIFNSLALKLSELQADQTRIPHSRLSVIEKKIQSIEMDLGHIVSAARIAQLEKRIAELEMRFASGS